MQLAPNFGSSTGLHISALSLALLWCTLGEQICSHDNVVTSLTCIVHDKRLVRTGHTIQTERYTIRHAPWLSYACMSECRADIPLPQRNATQPGSQTNQHAGTCCTATHWRFAGALSAIRGCEACLCAGVCIPNNTVVASPTVPQVLPNLRRRRSVNCGSIEGALRARIPNEIADGLRPGRRHKVKIRQVLRDLRMRVY